MCGVTFPSPLVLANKVLTRVQHAGIASTLRYLFGMYLLPLFGIQIKFIYLRSITSSAPADPLPTPHHYHYRVLSELRDFTPHILNQILRVSASQTPAVCASFVGAGRTCVLASDDHGTPHALLWLDRAPDHLSPSPEGCVLVRDVVTASASRGKGIAPLLIHAAITAVGQSEAYRSTTFIANSVLANTASSRMLEKAGFRRIGFSASFIGRGIAHWRHSADARTTLFRADT